MSKIPRMATRGVLCRRFQNIFFKTFARKLERKQRDQIWQNVLSNFLRFGNILKLGYFCKKIAYGQISFAANNGQIMKNNLVIWSH